MRKFQCLRLLLVKDFRTTIRRWGSLIVDVILFVILIAFCYWLMKEIGNKKEDDKPAEQNLAEFADTVVIKWPKLDYSDKQKLENAMFNYCPNIRVDKKGGDLGVTLRVSKYEPGNKKVKYNIEVVSEKVLVNTKEMYPNIYGVWNDFQSAQPINTIKVAYLSQLCFNLAFANITDQSIAPLETFEMPETITPSPYTHLGPFFIFIMLIMAILLIREVCVEKEISIHTYMVTMGLPRFTFYLSHLIFALIKFYLFLTVTLGLAIYLKGIDGLYFVIVVMLFANVMIAWMLMSAVLCYRSIYAILLVTAPVLIMFVVHLVFIGQQVLFNSMRATIYSLVNPVTAFMLLLYHMDFTRGINEKMHLFDNFKLYLPMAIPGGILILQSIVLLLLAFYFDYVLPLDNLPKEHPLFFLGFGRKKKVKKSDATDSEPPSEPKIPRDRLNIIELTKRWRNGDYAVNKASFSAKVGECTALLGHNGAGKSTVFGCLTGFLRPTSGTIEFPENEECEEDRKVGYCPQWNPLFPKLTVREHLEHYCELLTGFEPTKDNLKSLMIELQLYDARNTRSEKLSGGMKRKLSLGIALIGDAKVVLLDEPTSGMDMVARKVSFRMIAKAKQTKAIVLSTHYMDEADKLADAVVVMVRGHVVAKGSPGHLKGKFGTAVVLVVHFDFPHKVDRDVLVDAIRAVMIVVHKHCPLASLNSPIAGQVDILLTSANRREFTFLFADLEARKEELHIQSFNCKMNTLDQVFIKITDKTENVKDRADPSQLIREFISCRRNVSTGAGLFLRQFHGLAMRKWQNTRRDYIQPFLLLLCIFLAAAAMAYFHFKRKGPAGDSAFMDASLALGDYQEMSIALYGKNSLSDGLSAGLKKMSDKHEILKVDFADNVTRIGIMQDKRFLLPPRGLSYFFEPSRNVTMYFNKGFPNGPFFGIDAYFQTMMPDNIKTKLKLKIVAIKDKKNVLKESGDSLNAPLVALMVMCLVFPVIFAVPGFLYADERFAGAIHLYKRTKLSYFVYWLVGFLTDVLMCGIVVAIVMGFIYIFDGYSVYILLPLFVGIVLTAAAFLAQCYAASLLLSSGAATFAILIVVNVLMFFAIQKAMILTEYYFKYVKFLIFVFPSLAMHNYFNTVFINSGEPEGKSFMDFLKCPSDNGCEDPIIVLGVCAFLNLVIFFLVALAPWRRLCRPRPRAIPPTFKSDDVIAEQVRCDVEPINNFAIVSKYLRKDFGKRVAVRDFSIGVTKSECFGLLGANGAGKSTAFNMLTALIRPSDGKAFVGAVSVRRKPEFGYCPQMEAMLQNLTVFETMLLFARLNGNRRAKECAELVLQCLRLTLKRDILVKKCSGGEKRRVSIAVALMTNPAILMLDEPTAGVDPHTRRFILDTLLTLKSCGGAVFLTSHSMEECEQLCNRIGFMVDGRLVGIGTSQHLKQVYGNEYLITVILTEANHLIFVHLHDLITVRFKATLVDDSRGTHLYWKFTKTDTPISVLYADLDKVIDDVCVTPEITKAQIENYFITAMDLEDVFVAMNNEKPVPELL